jgi:STAM-binding protein
MSRRAHLQCVLFIHPLDDLILMVYIFLNRKHGIFHLTDPGGMGVIHDCQESGFHPHEEPLDGTSIYEHCSHVYMNPNVKFDMVDLRPV